MLKSIMQERWKSTLNTLMLILMAALKLEAENAVIAQMNKLGNSDKDMKRYAVLKLKDKTYLKALFLILRKQWK
jgi:hypothetical protein